MKAKVNGTEIAYVERGKGKNTIVFVHGLGENKESWRYQTEHFSNKARTIAVDLRGHGESGDSNISLDIFVEDLRALVDKLGAKEIILCGLSMGGAISLAFCSEYPERVKAMVLADTSSGFQRKQPRECSLSAWTTSRTRGWKSLVSSYLMALSAKAQMKH